MRDRFDRLAVRLARAGKAETAGLSRRDVIKRAGVVGGLTLASPLIQSVTSPAFAVSCSAGQTDCGGVCVNTLTDRSNCGGCGNQCVGTNAVCTAGVCQCTPASNAAAWCAANGKNCGQISDGCSGSVNCGSCSAPNTCGGGGTANVCGCTAQSNATTCGSRVCGTVVNNCGQSVNCGTCTSGKVCNGSGACV